MKDSKPLRDLQEDGAVTIENWKDYSSLVITKLAKSHAANYTCIATNAAGSDRYTNGLVVNAPPRWLLEPHDAVVLMGGTVRIGCQSVGYPSPVITWEKLDAAGESLVIPRVTLNETGRYKCSADNGVSPSLEHTLTVAVYGKVIEKYTPRVYLAKLHYNLMTIDILECMSHFHPKNKQTRFIIKGYRSIIIEGLQIPEIRPFAFPPNLRVGEKALLTCHVTSGSQPITFSWLKDGNTMAANQGIRLRSESEYSVMLMESVQPTHVGNYTCIAKNKHGFDSFTAVLEVESAPTWKGLVGDKSVDWNKTLQLDCPAVGYPQPKVSFKKKAGTPHENGTLVLEEVSTADEGQYTCEADNGMAPSATLTLSVTVNGVCNEHSEDHRVISNIDDSFSRCSRPFFSLLRW
ncbi:unnamed protein product [Ixodes persulcatus]